MPKPTITPFAATERALWIGMGNGIYTLKGEAWKQITELDVAVVRFLLPIGDHIVWAMDIDREGAGTLHQVHADGEAFSYAYPHSQPLDSGAGAISLLACTAMPQGACGSATRLACILGR